MTNELRTVLAGPRLALCVVGLLGAVTACSGSIDTQETKPSISGTGGGSGIGSLNPQPGINESSPNVSGRATGAGSDGEQSADEIDRASSPRGSGSSRGRNRDRDDRRDAGRDDDAGVADAGIELDGGVEVDAGAIDAGADAAP